jgi:hypothetical protein
MLATFFISPVVFAQETFRLKGYVIGDNQIEPGVDISVKNKKVSTTTDFKGTFIIDCVVGDTLIFENKYSRFAIEKYLVTDSLPVIVELVHKMELDEKGRQRLYGSVSRSNNFPMVCFNGTITGDQFWGAGYNFYPAPFFPDNSNLPVLNRVALGIACYSNGSNYYFFPNLGLNLRSYYNNLFHSNFGFSFMAPSVKLGTWISNESKIGFGYELGLSLLNFSFSNYSRFRNISFDVRYNNFLNNKGAFMVGLSIYKAFPDNDIPKFIKEAIK